MRSACCSPGVDAQACLQQGRYGGPRGKVSNENETRSATTYLVTELEESLHSAGTVLGSLSIVTVGHAHDQAGSLEPFDLSRSDELINDTLRVVGKVTELCFPHDQGGWGRKRVTVFETEDTVLAQTGVSDDEATLVLAENGERSVSGLALLVVQHSVTLRESTTLDVLT